MYKDLICINIGLGKTFIAAVVMFNWYRWAPEGQIAFLAPTKPLIAQQVDACYNICGIPKSETALLTGQVSPGQRAEYWKEKRVFYATPQTMANDLKRGYADPKRLVCIVIDEAHRATGSYSYVEVVKFVRRFNTSFRLLALTATPGSKVETVQDVIDALGIGKVEIRTEESLDIRQYIHRKNVETVTIDLSDEIVALKDAFGKCLKPILDDLRSKNACYLTDVEKLTAYTVMAAKNSWTQTPAAQNAHQGVKWQMLAKFSLLAQLAYPMQLLTCHGVRTFWSSLSSIQHESESSKNGGGKMKSAFFDHPDYKKLLTLARPLIDDDKFLGHPKMDYLNGAVLRHFVEASEDGGTAAETRVMIFSSYRDSAQEIVTMLEAHQPTIKPHIFVGQADAKANAGMPQKEQLQVYLKNILFAWGFFPDLFQ